MEQELLELGLSWNEVKVYKSLIKLGETQVGGVINDLKIHRQIAYNALAELEKRNMISKTMKNGIAHFKIQDPAVILENVKKQELLAKRLGESIQKEMKKSRHEHEINIFDGQEGARKFYMQIFKKIPVNSMCYVMGTSIKGHISSLGEDFLEGPYSKFKKEKNLISQLVLNESEHQQNEEFSQKTVPELRDTRYLPYENLNPISTTIWPDRISFMATGKDVFLIEIINQEFRDSFLDHFKMLWKVAKK